MTSSLSRERYRELIETRIFAPEALGRALQERRRRTVAAAMPGLGCFGVRFLPAHAQQARQDAAEPQAGDGEQQHHRQSQHQQLLLAAARLALGLLRSLVL